MKIVDRRNFPATDIAAAIVTLKPGGLRELHWHPNADEWQYYVKGNGPDDGLCSRWPGAHDGLRRGRRGVHRHLDAALYREYGG